MVSNKYEKSTKSTVSLKRLHSLLRLLALTVASSPTVITALIITDVILDTDTGGLAACRRERILLRKALLKRDFEPELRFHAPLLPQEAANLEMALFTPTDC
jgi:hypothetical protein